MTSSLWKKTGMFFGFGRHRASIIPLPRHYSPASSGISRGKRKIQDRDELIPSILEPVEDHGFSGKGSSKEYRKNWARFIRLRRADSEDL